MQGREKDIVIFSAVRSRKGARIGFVADERRINVGLTRARTSLLLVGNAAALSNDAQWQTFVDMATKSRYAATRQRKCWMYGVQTSAMMHSQIVNRLSCQYAVQPL